jgi:DivIVA domain-containing protein
LSNSSTRFRRVSRFARGYDVDEVDRFVTRVLSTLAAEPGATEPVSEAEAQRIVFRRVLGGYDPEAVDEALDQWVQRLRMER